MGPFSLHLLCQTVSQRSCASPYLIKKILLLHWEVWLHCSLLVCVCVGPWTQVQHMLDLEKA